eukprot:2384810-Alexandrium_andersonii.AAC.1
MRPRVLAKKGAAREPRGTQNKSRSPQCPEVAVSKKCTQTWREGGVLLPKSPRSDRGRGN